MAFLLCQCFGRGVLGGEFRGEGGRQLVANARGVSAGFAEFFYFRRKRVAFGCESGQLGVGIFGGSA